MECYLMGIEFQCAKEKEFCRGVVVNIFNTTELYTLKWLRWLFKKDKQNKVEKKFQVEMIQRKTGYQARFKF